MAYTSKNPKFDTVIFDDVGLSGSVANPASGSDKIVNRGGNFFSRSSTGAEKPLGGGSGEINVFTDTDGIGATWVASGAGVTVANTSTTSEIALSPIKTTAIKLTNVSGTDYMRGRFTMPAGLKNKKLKLEFFQQALSGYVTGDNKVEIYTNTLSNYTGTYVELPLSTDVSGTSSLPNLTGKFTTYFDSNSLDYYEVRIVRVSGTAAITFGGVVLGSGIQPQGAVVSGYDSVTLTPNGAFGTVSDEYYVKKRIGNAVNIVGNLVTGTVTSGAGQIDLPTGITIDSAAYPTGGKSIALGLVYNKRNTPVLMFSNDIVGVLFYDGSDTNSLYITNRTDAGNFEKVPLNTFLSSNSEVMFDITFYVAEWAGSGVLQLAENAVEYASNSGTWDSTDTTSFAYGPAGQALGGTLTAARTKRVKFTSPILDGDQVIVEGSSDGSTWFPMIGSSLNNIVVIPALDNAGTNGSGVALKAVSSTEVDVVFGQYINISNNDSVNTNWPSTNAYWRVKKVAANQALGFGVAAASATGLAPKGVFNQTEDSVINLQPRATTPANPASSSDVKQYVKGSLFILQYNDAGTVRWKYLDMAGTGVTWVHTTTAP